MKEQVNKIVYDFKQGLGQQSFYAFDLLRKHVTEESARDLVLEELDRIASQFDGEVSGPTPSLNEVETDLNNEIIQANQQGDMIRVMEIEDDLTAIRRVRSLVERKTNN